MEGCDEKGIGRDGSKKLRIELVSLERAWLIMVKVCKFVSDAI